jgi:glycerol-3-phosphate acyltransferase PlsX
MHVVIDGMGGDHAPEEVVKGAAQAADEYGIEITVVGLADRVLPLLNGQRKLRFTPASQVVAMDEHPAQAIRKKTDSSMSVCARLCRDRRADAWVSAGNSGAIMAAALLIQGRIRGVERPALGSVMPTAGGPIYFLDVGANVDSRPEYLQQFAEMGAVYASEVMGRSEPRVALLSNGEEPDKGDQRVREAHARLKRSRLNFVGNIEAKDLLAGRADVVVADGFVGNVAIKMAEATADFIFRTMREEVPRSPRGRLGGLLIRPDVQRIRSLMDWREFGGAPLLGIDGVAVVAHGRSDARAVKNAIRVAREAVDSQLVSKIRGAVGRSNKY